MKAEKPWTYHARISESNDKPIESLLEKRNRTPQMLNQLKMVYDMLMENYSVLNTDFYKAFGRRTKIVKLIDIISYRIPVWQEEEPGGFYIWYGLLDKSKRIEELDDYEIH